MSSFPDNLKRFTSRIPQIREHVLTEEGTKQSLILPFLQILGYNVFDPEEVRPEYTADIGVKQNEKVDYALLRDGEPSIIMECKSVGANLEDTRKVTQLMRYFTATSARIGVLTDGIQYKFYSDLDQTNVMDDQPFQEFDLENLSDHCIDQLQQFSSGFDTDSIIELASTMRYVNGLKRSLEQQYISPNEDFVRALAKTVSSERMTQAAIEKFTALVRRALHEFVDDRITGTLKAAQSLAAKQQMEDAAEQKNKIQPNPIITTANELQAFGIVKDLLQDTIGEDRVKLRDFKNHCNILLDGNGSKPLLRLILDKSPMQIEVFNNDNPQNHNIDSITNIYDFADHIRFTAKKYTEPVKEDTPVVPVMTNDAPSYQLSSSWRTVPPTPVVVA